MVSATAAASATAVAAAIVAAGEEKDEDNDPDVAVVKNVAKASHSIIVLSVNGRVLPFNTYSMRRRQICYNRKQPPVLGRGVVFYNGFELILA